MENQTMDNTRPVIDNGNPTNDNIVHYIEYIYGSHTSPYKTYYKYSS